MSKISSWHNGLESDSVNSPVNVTTGLKVGNLSFPSIAGSAWFVDASSTAGTGANGKTKASAFTTIAAAISAAASHDTIIVYPGTYAENLVVTTDYLNIVGAASGYGRPDVQPATGVCLTVTAQGFVCSRMRFAAANSDAVRQKGNGFSYTDCVFDGDSAQAATDALVRLKGDDDDDSYTASEGVIADCLFRGSDGFGIALQAAEAPGNGVGVTHTRFENCRFQDNVAADVVTLDNDGTDGTYSAQDVIFDRCIFAEPKNKATWVDFTTANGGAAGDQTGAFIDCFFNDDTVDTTAIKATGTGFGFVGCHSMDGEFDGSGLD